MTTSLMLMPVAPNPQADALSARMLAARRPGAAGRLVLGALVACSVLPLAACDDEADGGAVGDAAARLDGSSAGDSGADSGGGPDGGRGDAEALDGAVADGAVADGALADAAPDAEPSDAAVADSAADGALTDFEASDALGADAELGDASVGDALPAGDAVVVDERAPSIEIDFPRDDHMVRGRRLRVLGRVTDAGGLASVSLSTGEHTVAVAPRADGRFEAWVPLVPGANTWRLEAVDGAGNAAAVVRSAWFGHRLAAGGAHGGALVDGQLYVWGRNNLGQTGLGYLSVLGDTEPAHPAAATPLATAVPFVSLAFAQNASIALDAEGRIWGFGDNARGQLCLGGGPEAEPGVPDTENRWVPTRAPGIEGVVAVTRGYSHTLLLRDDGTVWGCGNNGSGQLGDGTVEARDVPVQAEGLSDIVAIMAGSESSYALDAEGVVWAFGRNQYGNLGQGTEDREAHPLAMPVPGLGAVVDLAGGRDHVVAVARDGAVWAWGLNASTQVGPEGIGGFEGNVLSPLPVVVPEVLEAGEVDAEGMNAEEMDSEELAPGDGEGAWVGPAVAVYASGNQGFFEDVDGRLWGWGQNGNTANLGIPQNGDQAVPTVPVFGIEAVVDVAIGPLHGFARTDDGVVFAWGWSFQGSLGAGEAAIPTWGYRIPVLVRFLTP